MMIAVPMSSTHVYRALHVCPDVPMHRLLCSEVLKSGHTPATQVAGTPTVAWPPALAPAFQLFPAPYALGPSVVPRTRPVRRTGNQRMARTDTRPAFPCARAVEFRVRSRCTAPQCRACTAPLLASTTRILGCHGAVCAPLWFQVCVCVHVCVCMCACVCGCVCSSSSQCARPLHVVPLPRVDRQVHGAARRPVSTSILPDRLR